MLLSVSLLPIIFYTATLFSDRLAVHIIILTIKLFQKIILNDYEITKQRI